MKYIDTHAHVTARAYEDELENVIKQLKEENTFAYNIGTTVEDSKEILELSKKHENLIPVIGVHPCDTQEWNDNIINELESLINDEVAAIGEIGLDYYHEPYNKQEQAIAFKQQIELAKKYELPVVVHTRESLEDCFNIVKEYPTVKFLFHSWSGDEEMTNRYLSISENVYFSYNGILTFKNAQMQKDIIKLIPTDRLMFETDCPWLSPEPYRGQKNFPWRVKEVIAYAAEQLELTIEEMNEINNVNVKKFYKK